MKSTFQFQTGHLTSSVGSGVLGSTLVAGLVTAGPALTVGLFAGTVLPSVAGIYFISDYLLQKMENRRKKLQSRTTLEHVA